MRSKVRKSKNRKSRTRSKIRKSRSKIRKSRSKVKKSRTFGIHLLRQKSQKRRDSSPDAKKLRLASEIDKINREIADPDIWNIKVVEPLMELVDITSVDEKKQMIHLYPSFLRLFENDDFGQIIKNIPHSELIDLFQTLASEQLNTTIARQIMEPLLQMLSQDIFKDIIKNVPRLRTRYFFIENRYNLPYVDIQKQANCAQHAINNVFARNKVSCNTLRNICHDLENEEKSDHCNDRGNFSDSVLMRYFDKNNIKYKVKELFGYNNIEKKNELLQLLNLPAIGFILGDSRHWFAIRKTTKPAYIWIDSRIPVDGELNYIHYRLNHPLVGFDIDKLVNRIIKNGVKKIFIIL